MSDMFYGAGPEIHKKAKFLRGNMTPAEIRLWKSLCDNQLRNYKFRRQHPIASYIVDFYCHSALLVIELDGEYHNDLGQMEYDIGRSYELRELGLTVLRFSNYNVMEFLPYVLSRIESQLNSIP